MRRDIELRGVGRGVFLLLTAALAACQAQAGARPAPVDDSRGVADGAVSIQVSDAAADGRRPGGPSPANARDVLPQSAALADAGSPSTPAPTDAAPASADAAPSTPLPAQVQSVWAAGDGETIERDAATPAHPSSVWDGTRIKLTAARNEVIAFQVLVRAQAPGIAALSARLPALDGGASSIRYLAPGADPSESRDRPIQLFPVNYMNVKAASNATWIYVPGSAGAPAHPTGWKPVQLVPENARQGGLPVAVPGGLTQSLWFEIYTGHDRPAGVYRGAVEITADGGSRSIPIELEVLDFALPDANSLTAMVYYSGSQPELYQGRNLDAVYHRFAHRQRIELVDAYDEAGLTAAAGRFDGRDFTPAAGYEGPGQGVGNRVAPASFWGPGSGWDDRATAWPRADRWMQTLAARVPDAITFLYMPDEPGSGQFPGIRAIADVVHANPGPGKDLPILVTHGFDSGLDGAIDIWCSVPRAYDMTAAAAMHSKGRDWWFYNGGRPAGPALVMDAPISDARVIGWAAFAASTPVYFYWNAVHWRHNAQKTVGDRNQNVWANPVTYDQRNASGSGSFANGDGVLMYPGTEVLHPDQDRGIAGPIGTVALANLRRGLQDHQYLTLAKKCGLQPLVDKSLRAIVPKVFNDAGPAVSFPQDGEAFEAARLELGRALATCQP